MELQFRIGILPSYVERGRISDIQIDSRLFASCNLNVIEDEYHDDMCLNMKKKKTNLYKLCF